MRIRCSIPSSFSKEKKRKEKKRKEKKRKEEKRLCFAFALLMWQVISTKSWYKSL